MRRTSLSRALIVCCTTLLCLGVACHGHVEDDRLYAAAGRAVITPTEENHPETLYLGGVFPSRMATGVHDDLLASALILKQGADHVVLVSLDLIGLNRSRIREIQDRLASFGLDREHVLIASTHTHESPDTIGVYGPNVLTSGVSRTYMAFIQDTIVDLVLEVRDRLEPVTIRAARAEVNVPISNYPSLIADMREPAVTVSTLSAAAFQGTDGGTVATLINWHSHPEVMIESTEVSSDFPAWTRMRMESVLGGTSVYISGALGGLSSPTGVDVPARDEGGEPLFDDQSEPILLRGGSWDKTRSLGFVIADMIVEALAGVEPVEAPELSVTVEALPLPATNPVMLLTFLSGLVDYDPQDLITDRPEMCGLVGCISERLAVVRLGPIALITSPGETFPETWIGRDTSTADFGQGWGSFPFPAIKGLAESLHVEVPMHMTNCGDSIGYLVPCTDYHLPGHPDFYEEALSLGRETETLYREAVMNLLERDS